eukprot:GHVH01004253.1.p1 GENE.GHVH01004253.1~~GHVH01004253.1.p1  ORF type:complete len:540 (+),score=69.66 GHVH01004253.1:24-1643(+)
MTTENNNPTSTCSISKGSETSALDTIDENIKSEADSLKVLGNGFFASKSYPCAIRKYTEAIELLRSNVESHDGEVKNRILKHTSLAVYLINRAMCNLKVENYGSAILDVTDALELEPNDKIKSKAYYRQGFAHYALLKIEDALADFKACLQLEPNCKSTRNYVVTLQKEIRKRKFAVAIAKPDEIPLYERLSLDYFVVPPTYNGPSWLSDCDDLQGLMTVDVTIDFIKELVDHFKQQKRLPNRISAAIILRTISLLKEDKNCVEITVEDGNEITICGDVHGQFYDLINIFSINGFPSAENPYIFNGDFVDRGSWSVECALLLFACKIAFPEHFFLSRGNHETKNINKIYGFKGECDSKFKVPELYDLFSEAFMWLPLCHMINGKVFCVHGGLPSDDAQGLDEINALGRYSEPTNLQISSQVLLNDLLWADPRPEHGRVPSPRGVSSHFGPDITMRFLERNSLEYIIRSHEVKDDGYEVMHDGKMITVFSAPNYCDMVKNKGAFIRLQAPELEPKFTQFTEVDHPSCSALQYASPLIQMS